MRTMKRILCVLLVTVLLCGALPLSATAATKSVVEKRIEAITKVYPQGSTFEEWVVTGQHGFWTQERGGCSGLVAYVTQKVFGTPFCCEDCGGYSKVGSADPSKPAAVKKLVAKAKPGDVVEWIKGTRVAHHAIFLSDNANGIRIYEANFVGPRGISDEVWYDHQWSWNGIYTWTGGGSVDKLVVYRANNYNAVNKGKAAKEPAKGKTFTVSSSEKVKVKVLSSAVNGGKVRLVSGYKEGATLPKYVAIKDEVVTAAFRSKSQYKNYDANSFRIYEVVKAPGVSKKVTAKPAAKSVKLSWKKVSGAAGYRVYQYNPKTKKYVTVKSGTTATSLTVKGLKKGTRYKFAVKAYTKVGGTRIWAEKGKSVTATTKKR